MLTQNQVLELIKQYPKGYSSSLRFKHSDLIEYLNLNIVGESPGEKLYNWIYPNAVKQCLLCSKPTKFKQFDQGYREYCSCSCRAKHKQSNLNGLTAQAIAKRKQWRANRTAEDISRQAEKLRKTNLERYGSISKQMSEERKAQNEIAKIGQAAYDQLSNFEWISEQYKIKTISRIAKELGVTYSVVSKYIKKFALTTAKTRKFSKQEQELVEFIQSLGVANIEQHNKTLLAPKEIDIYLPDLGLAFEFCGCYWHSDSNKLVTVGRKDKNYHQNKFVALKQKQIKLITIFDIDWSNHRSILESRIRNLCKMSTNIVYGRNCTVVQLTKDQSRDFFKLNHSQGHSGFTVCYGLEYQGKIVSAMSFRKPRFTDKYQWEIIRFASVLNTNVVGAGSKLFKRFVLDQQPSSVISYSDNCWGFGEVYAALGFTMIDITQPSYYYVELKNMNKKYHRSAFMKHKILKMGGDPSLTEFENMKNMGYFRIWDCGTTKWVWGQ